MSIEPSFRTESTDPAPLDYDGSWRGGVQVGLAVSEPAHRLLELFRARMDVFAMQHDDSTW